MERPSSPFPWAAAWRVAGTLAGDERFRDAGRVLWWWATQDYPHAVAVGAGTALLLALPLLISLA